MTAKVTPFSIEKARKSARQARPKPGWNGSGTNRRWEAYRFVDLGGKRPIGHPAVERGPRGGIRLAERQVWISLHDQRLWVIQWLEPQAGGRHRVALMPYRFSGGECFPWEISSLTLRSSLRIWDDVGRVLATTAAKLRTAALDRGIDPGRTGVFFGIDPTTGERTHD